MVEGFHGGIHRFSRETCEKLRLVRAPLRHAFVFLPLFALFTGAAESAIANSCRVVMICRKVPGKYPLGYTISLFKFKRLLPLVSEEYHDVPLIGRIVVIICVYHAVCVLECQIVFAAWPLLTWISSHSSAPI